MTTPTQSNPQARRRVVYVCITIATLSLVPHLARSFDVTDGLRVGASASTNEASSTAIMLGYYNTNPSPAAAAIGWYNSLGGPNYGYGSLAVGCYNTLSGYTAFAFGHSNIVYAMDSMGLGSYNTVAGASSLAFGEGCMTASSGRQSLAGGHYNYAVGDSSAALGYYTSAYSHASLVIGRYNQPVGDESTNSAAATSWRNQDSLFVIGNGTSNSSRNNVFQVSKDGTIKMQRQGDILMGEFTAP